MALVWFTPIEENKALIDRIHNFPEILTEEQKQGSIELPNDFMNILLDRVTIPDGKSYKTYINPNTTEVWLEFYDRPLTQEERIKHLEDLVAELLHR